MRIWIGLCMPTRHDLENGESSVSWKMERSTVAAAVAVAVTNINKQSTAKTMLTRESYFMLRYATKTQTGELNIINGEIDVVVSKGLID